MGYHLAKGMRDFLPAEMNQRLAVLDTVGRVFRSYGFEPLETPAVERIDTLLGKYGGDTDKLMFRIIKRGQGAERGECDLALRYDLTVPLARVIAMNPGLRLPFKRYQIERVWRADRPQRGRFREFYQCDVDVIGTASPVADAECLAVAADTLTALGLDDYTLQVNDRRILTGLFAAVRPEGPGDIAAQELSFLIAVDKLDKIGRDGVENELRERLPGLGDLASVWVALEAAGDNDEVLARMAGSEHERVRIGAANLREVVDQAIAMGVPAERIRIEPTLARGADYYTGTVIEARLPDFGSSILGGGRYDELIGRFSGRPMPAVGLSLGIDRILLVLAERGLHPARPTAAEVLVTVFDDDRRPASIAAARALRTRGVATELYVGDSRLKAQLKLANARGFPWLAIVGPDEAEAGEVTLKHLPSGREQRVAVADAADAIRAG